MPFPLLTARLIIEPLRLSDVDDFVSYRRDPEISRYQGWDENFSHQQAQELINSQGGGDFPQVGEWLQLAVRQRVNGKLLGDLALHRLEDLDGVFELGFTIAKQHQRLGYAKESIGALIDYLPTQIKVDKFFAQTDRRNLASIRLLLALNFFPNHSKSYSEQFKGEMVFVEYFERPFQVMTPIGKNVVRD